MSFVARYGLVVVFVAVCALFSIVNSDTFPTLDNAQTVASTQAVVAVVALAAMVPLVTGQLDLSLGFVVGLGQALCAGLMIKEGLPAGLAMLIVLAAGVAVGAINGLLVVRMRMNAFIATLGTGILVLGATEWYTGNLIITGSLPPSFLDLGQSQLGPVPLPFVYVLVCCAALWIALEYTAWGRRCFAAGGNPRAALLAGVNVDRVTMQSFVVAGLLAGVAGILSVAIIGSSSPGVGLNYLLPAFAGAFLGATSIRPGRFNAIGTVIGIYLIAVGITGLQQLGAAFYTTEFFNGGALLIAVALSAGAARRQRAKSAAAAAAA
ncbi:MAG: ribose transport system permease protein [Thermoleophilaceae bacterium]|jgi:ribose transport system permease protein|nr:ribose transport system permease protein [Thermoleophilaceae bacterium]